MQGASFFFPVYYNNRIYVLCHCPAVFVFVNTSRSLPTNDHNLHKDGYLEESCHVTPGRSKPKPLVALVTAATCTGSQGRVTLSYLTVARRTSEAACRT